MASSDDEVLRYNSYGTKYEVPRKLVSSLDDLESGDHIAFHRMGGVLWHHAIVEDVNKRSSEFCLIEYSNDASGFLMDNFCCPRNPGIAKVVRKTYRFSKGTMVYLMLHECCYPADTVVENARSKIGENKYNAFTNNCEHFAMWCKTGTSSSDQVNKAAQMVGKEIRQEVAGRAARATAEHVGRTVSNVVTRAANEIPIAYNHVTEGIVGAATNLQKAGGELFANMPPLRLPSGGEMAANLPTMKIGSRIVGAATNLQKAGGALFAKMPPLRLPTGGGLPPLFSTGAGRAAKLISRGGQAITRTGIGGVLAAGALPAIVEGMSMNNDLNNLRRDRDEKRIDGKEYDKTVTKRIVTGAGYITGATAGTLIGQAFIPVPVVGAAVGGVVGGIAGRYFGNIGGNLAVDKKDGDGANYAENSKEDSEEDLGGGGQYYCDGGPDYVEESDEENEDVLGDAGYYSLCGRADYADNDDVEDEEDNFPEKDGGADDYVGESDEDNEEGLGGGGYYSHFSRTDYADSNYVEDNEDEEVLQADSADESDKDSEEDLGKSAVHASSCGKKSGCTKRLMTHRLKTVSLSNYAVMLIILIMLLTVFTRVVS